LPDFIPGWSLAGTIKCLGSELLALCLEDSIWILVLERIDISVELGIKNLDLESAGGLFVLFGYNFLER